MIINESKSNYFNIKTTGMDKYDHILNNLEDAENELNMTYKIVWMYPSEYIARCARDIFNCDFDRLFDNRNDKKISKYAKMMKNGEKFDMPIINYAEHQQEGCHRSLAAFKINPEELIPVMVIYNKVPLSKFKPNKGVSKNE